MQKKRIHWLCPLVLIACLLAVPSLAAAAMSVVDGDNLKVNLTNEIGAGLFTSDDSNFGADGDDAAGWYEAYFKPILNASYDTKAGNLYGGLSYVASATRGDGDIAGFTSDQSDGVSSELSYVGWTSGDLFPNLGENAVDLSFGEQEFAIGDGFLVMDGEFDFADGAYWLAPHRSFEQAALVKINTRPVRADIFQIKSGDDQGDTELRGVNLEYIDSELGTLGGSWMTVSESNFAARDGMDIYSIRGQGTPLVEELFLAFEYVHEDGGDQVDIDADGWYAEAGYTLAALPWNPTLNYRYASFSGDDLDTADNEAFDPLFYGFSRGWGTHFMGEITGEYYLFNSNENVNMVHLNMAPSDKLSVGALFYDFKLDEKNYYGTPVSDDDFTTEVNLYADYAVNDNFWLSGVFGMASPGTAAEEVFGNGKDTTLFEVYGIYYF